MYKCKKLALCAELSFLRNSAFIILKIILKTL